jgi:glucan biosynthesis protein C
MIDTRRYDVDWLRIFATYLLFVFHSAMVFNPAPFYHVRNAELSFGMLVLAGFISLWHMPLFFLLAGWSIRTSLVTRGIGTFLRERVTRLLVPLVTGCVLFGPIVKYLELRSGLDLSNAGLRVAPAWQDGFRLLIPGGLPAMPPFDESFVTFLPTYFTRLERFTWMHLWFLAYLFTFSLLYLPLFTWIARRTAGPRAAKADPASSSRTRVWVYAPLLPLIVIQLTLRERWPGLQNLYDDWANFAYFSAFLLAGFALASLPALETAVVRERRRLLVLGTVAALALLLAVANVLRTPALLLAATAIAGWCFVLVLFGTAARLRTTDIRGRAYLAESSLPVYVLHQVAIVGLGFAIVRLNLGIALKFTLLLVTSVALTLAVYELVVRRVGILRLLFGMRRIRKMCPVRTTARAAAVLAAAVLLVADPAASTAANPIGRWYAEGGAAQVEIRPCGDRLCGQVIWLRAPLDENGCQLRDRENPDPSRRDLPLIGLEIVRDLAPAGTDGGHWSGGTIYDPTSGRSYSCDLTIVSGHRLLLHGYVGVRLLGRTTTWIRVGTEERMCAASHDPPPGGAAL